MIRLLHTADIHIGMENYGRIDPVTGIHTRLLDFQKALHECIDHAIKDEIDVFVFAGDAYKTAHPTPTHQRILCDAFLRLARARIPVVMVTGNHDNPFNVGRTHALDIFRQIPTDYFHVLHKPDKLVLATRQGPLQIVGIPWPSRSMVQTRSEVMLATQGDITRGISLGVAHIIQELASSCDHSIPAILMGHLTVSNGIFSGSEKRAIYGSDPTLMPSQLAIAPFDYVALGHLHRYQNLNPHGYPAVVYSGSLERIDFGERKEEKGFCRVDIPAKGQAVHTFHQVVTRPCIQIDIALRPDQPPTAQILSKIAEYDLRDAIVKIVYQVPAGMRDPIDKQAIMQACHAAHYIAGIVPVHAPAQRTQRVFLALDMKPHEHLQQYLHAQQLDAAQVARVLAKSERLAALVEHPVAKDISAGQDTV